MPYTKTTWDETLPVTPARLNNMETQYEKALADYPKPLNYDDELSPPILTVGAGKMFSRIQDALDALKNVNAGKHTIQVDPGTYNEVININELHCGEINILSSTGVANSIKVPWNVLINKNTAMIWLYDFDITAGDQTFVLEYSRFIYIGRSTKSAPNNSIGRGLVASHIQELNVENCTFSNQSTGMEIMGSKAMLTTVAGSGNSLGISATNGSTVHKVGNVTLTGTSPTFISGGSQILG